MHAVRAQRLGGECRGHRRVDPARHADDDLAKAVLADVVVQAQLEREPHLLELRLERDDAARRLAPVARGACRAHVNDVHRRDLLTLARERAATEVAQPAADHLLRLDVDDEQSFLEAGRAGEHRAFVVQHARMSVEDQLVLAAHRVAERDEARVVPRAGHEHLLTLVRPADVERRRREVHDQLGAREREIGRRRAGLPQVLAHRDADECLAVLEQDQIAARCEIAILVEHAVIGEEALAVDSLDLAAGEDVARVVEITVEERRADEDGCPSGGAGELLHRFLGRADEAGP